MYTCEMLLLTTIANTYIKITLIIYKKTIWNLTIKTKNSILRRNPCSSYCGSIYTSRHRVLLEVADYSCRQFVVSSLTRSA